MTAHDTVVGAVIFTDLVGFTEFNEAMGDAVAVEALDRQLSIATEVVTESAGARVVKELGDGLLLWVPDGRDAVEAARSFLTHVDAARATGEFPLAVRLGIHFGEVVTRNDDLAGRTVNVAARIVDLAGPGELLASDAAVVAADGTVGHGFEPVGPATVKGVSTPIWLYRAIDVFSA